MPKSAVDEKDVLIKTPEGTSDAVLFAPKKTGQFPAVLMWPDIMGLRPTFRDMGRRLAAEGYVVLVPNPFYRSKKAPVMEGPIDFGNPATRWPFASRITRGTTSRRLLMTTTSIRWKTVAISTSPVNSTNFAPSGPQPRSPIMPSPSRSPTLRRQGTTFRDKCLIKARPIAAFSNY